VEWESIENANVVPWIIGKSFVTENRKPIEFINHRCFIDYLADDHPNKVMLKCAQVGATVLEAIDDFHLAGKRKMNVIHTLHTSDVIKGLVVPKINPLIEYNPAIKDMVVGVDSESMKRFNDNYVYYRGANAESQAISISADVLKIDELDRSNPVVAEMFLSRLDASDYKWLRRFSNPSAIGFGVDGLWQLSNQFHWIIQCHHCTHKMYIDFNQSTDLNHYIDKERKIYACGKCHKDINNKDRINGEWVPKYPSRTEIHGYWFSQLMMAWFDAPEIITKQETSSIEYFHNFVLGKAYTPSDMIVDRQAILRACAPSNIQREDVAMGVDQDAGGQYYVLMTFDGVFDYGYVDSWDKIEHLKLMYKCPVVCDPAPYPTMPSQMATKYNDWYNCRFRDSKNLSAVEWKSSDNVVYADRTRVIDIVANEIVNGKILFRQRPSELEGMIAHWNNLYRTTVENEDGRIKSTWMKKEGRQSDYPFALTYARIALSRTMRSGSELLEPMTQSQTKVTNLSTDDGKRLTIDFKDIIEETFDRMEQ